MTQLSKQQANITTAILHKLSQSHSLPEYVKQASMDDLVIRDKLKVAAETYIMDGEHIYPSHNKAATWVSYATLRHRPDEGVGSEKVSAFLLKRADLLGIKQDCLKVDSDLTEVTKTAEETDERFPLRNAAEVSAAVQFLRKEVDKPTWTKLADRNQLAIKLASCGEEARVLDPAVMTAGCYGGCLDNVKLADKLEKLAGELEDEDKSASISQMAAAIKNNAGGLSLQRVHGKIAEFLEDLGVDVGTSPEKFATTSEPCAYTQLGDGSVVKRAAVVGCGLSILDHPKIDSIEDLAIGQESKKIKIASEQLDREEQQQLLDHIAEADPEAVLWRAPRSLQVVGL